MDLVAGNKIGQSLPAGHILAFTVPAGTTGSIVRHTNPSGGEPYAPIPLNGANLVLGPFSVVADFEIACSLGALSFAVKQWAATDTDDNAGEGAIGEYKESRVLVGNAVALITNTDANVTSLLLTPGDWEVSGTAGFKPAATTSLTHLSESISFTSATMENDGKQSAVSFPPIVPGTAPEWHQPTPVVRISIAVPTVIYLVAHATFTVSTLGAYGVLRARRAR